MMLKNYMLYRYYVQSKILLYLLSFSAEFFGVESNLLNIPDHIMVDVCFTKKSSRHAFWQKKSYFYSVKNPRFVGKKLDNLQFYEKNLLVIIPDYFKTY